MTPTEELLAIRERCAAEWVPGEWFTRNGIMSFAAYSLLHNQIHPHWPYEWFCRIATTRLQVVEMIERAAVAAMKSEGT
jgi:hypothetical protein